MKNTKKLTILGLSAATALVAATGAVSSFAWFATNSQVTAEGMVIKAESTNAFLEIKNAKTSEWDNSKSNVAVDVQAEKTIKPTSLVSQITDENKKVTPYQDGGTVHQCVSATASSVDSAAATSVFADVTTEAEALGGTNVYTLISDFDLRLRYTAGMTTDNYNLSATVNWAGENTGDLADSVRVFMVIGDVGAQSLPESLAGASGMVFSARSSWNTGKVLSNKFVANKEQKGTRVRVFAYFDGEDPACTTVNAMADSSYSFTITFSVSK